MHGHCGRRWIKFALLALVGIGVAVLAVMLLWNWLVPALFNGPHIHFLQALGLLILSRILFRGHPHFRGHWHRHMEARMQNMTPEEREKFHAGMRCCGRHDESEKSPAAE